MATRKGRRANDEPGHPDHPDNHTVVAFGFDPASGLATTRIALEVTPHAAPDELQDDVIEPTAIFNPGVRLPDWSNVEITVEYHD